MKSLYAVTLAILLVQGLNGQNSAVDKLFDKYSGREGYTSVYISKYMFSMFSNLDPDNKEFNDLVGKLSSIKILAADNTVPNSNVNFYRDIVKELPMSQYKELMVIREKDKDMKFLVMEVNGRVQELLLIVGGKDDNTLICIQGENINLKNIAKLSKSMKIDGLENLEKIDGAKPK